MPSDKYAWVIEERWNEKGVWKAKATYTATGTLMAEYSYADSTRNTLHGKHTLYSTNRKKLREITYNMGTPDGPFAEWSADGIPIRKGNLKGEMLWGNVEIYTADGSLKATMQTDENGNGSGREFLSKTGVTGEGPVKTTRQDGLWIYKDSSGRKIMEVTYNEKGIAKETCFDGTGQPISGGDCFSDRPAEYPGGPDAWLTYLNKNLKYPKELRREEIQGIVILKFLVREDGSIGSIKVVESPDPLFSAEATRVIRESGKWKPAIEANKVVPYLHVQSFNFYLK
jgi:TonB family protein